ncbi:MAG: hypothetical protein H0V25_11710 [Solirubrobacterales bacterium]|nr:hypothetical protein [Solirubrobacterales bacterium]
MTTEPADQAMSEERARELCAQLAATHADRSTHQWLPRRAGEGWQVMKVAIPPPEDVLQASQQAEPSPSPADDPRTAHDQNVGPWVGPV